MTRDLFRALLCAATLAAALPRTADACGNNTHAWISLDAVSRLEPGPLKDLLSRPDLERYLRNGTMFPDGGYAIGDGYGEMAHWEPFQDRYLQWIREHYSPPWSDEAAAHIAFLFGMHSHGMADQVYDSTFMEGSKPVDSGWHTCGDGLFCSFDTQTDLMWAYRHGPQPNPDRWIPPDFPALYQAANHTVSAEEMTRGTDQVGLAIALVASGGSDESLRAQSEADFPWAYARIDNPERGAPRDIARVVALYWPVIWERLNGGDWVQHPVLATLPPNGSYSHVRDHSDVASRVGIVFARGLEQSALKADFFTLVDSKGAAHPFDMDLFYGQSSHVVNLHPRTDFAENETYTVTVAPGITAIDGHQSAQPFQFSFSTAPPPPEPTPTKKQGCSSFGAGWVALLPLLAVRRKTLTHSRGSPPLPPTRGRG